MKWPVPVTMLVFVLSPFGVLTTDGQSPRTELLVLTGTEQATYFEMSNDLKRLLEEVGRDLPIRLAVVPSQGALENVIKVFRHRSIQLGMTQEDVLAYLEIYGKGSSDVVRIIDGLQAVLPLPSEEVHLFARSPIGKIADLEGKRVAVGPGGSGTMVSALALLYLAGVEPRELVHQEVGESIAALRRGEIDAFFRVVGSPSEFLAANIEAGDAFVFVPIHLSPKADAAAFGRHYAPSTIPAHTYAWQEQAVETVAVRSLLITSTDVVPGKPDCEAIGQLARLAVDNQAWLREHGHPAWKRATLDEATVLGTSRLSPCVAQQWRR